MYAKRDFACMPRYIRAHETTSSGHSTGSEPNTLGLIVQALLACGLERTDETLTGARQLAGALPTVSTGPAISCDLGAPRTRHDTTAAPLSR